MAPYHDEDEYDFTTPPEEIARRILIVIAVVVAIGVTLAMF